MPVGVKKKIGVKIKKEDKRRRKERG